MLTARSLKSIGINMTLVFFSIFFTLGITEVLLRFTPYKNLVGIPPPTSKKPIDGYLQKDPQLGHDINKNIRSATHSIGSFTYEVFSNQYGCYDTERQVPDDYALIVGDSFTWGYTPLPQKWTTYLEEKTGIFMLKCGVSGYGTRQELMKAQRVIHDVGKTPKYLILMYCYNDLNDDFFFPYIGKGRVTRTNLLTGEVDLEPEIPPMNKKNLRKDEGMARGNKKENYLNSTFQSVREFFRTLRYKTVIYTLYRLEVKPRMAELTQKVLYGNRMPPSTKERLRPNLIDYVHQADQLDWYNQLLQYHKQSLRNFVSYAHSINAKFLIIDMHGSLDHAMFKEALSGDQTYYYNLKNDYPKPTQWQWDGHWNIEGNQEVGKFVFQHYKKIGVFDSL